MLRFNFKLAALAVGCCCCQYVAAQDTELNAGDNYQKLQASGDPTQMFEPREYRSESGDALRYRLLKPLDYQPDRKYPLVIFLHGAGERGDDNVSQLKHGLTGFCSPQWRKKFNCYIIAPQCPEGEKWADVDWSSDQIRFPEEISSPLGLTFDVVDSMLENAGVDKRQIYITGLSMGGYGTWDALARRPDFFAAAMPICGGGDPATASKFAHVPIHCFHGGSDNVVKPEYSRDMIKALEDAGGDPKYTEYPGVGHDSWTQTYADEANIEWLFSQRKSGQTSSSERNSSERAK